MLTAESVKAKLQSLIDTANETTGKADSDLTAAMASLLEGYGSGGGGVESGEITLSEKTHAVTVAVSGKKNHMLIVPKSLTEAYASHLKDHMHGGYARESGISVTFRMSFANSADASAFHSGTMYWGGENYATQSTFDDTSITFRTIYGPLDPTITYVWFAW